MKKAFTLAEVFSPHPTNLHKTAFTLSEVLITLGIIGVVAALTLPTLIASYQKKQTTIQLKKTYSIMKNALQKAELDYEEIINWDFELSEEDFKNKYFKPYYNVIMEYNKDTFPDNIHNTCINGDNCDGYSAFKRTSKIVLTDGTMLSFEKLKIEAGVIVNILVDINGLRKPNRYGRDVFLFSVHSKKGLQPYGVGYIAGSNTDSDFDRNKLMNTGDGRCCNKNRHGVFCAALIMTDGWEIKDDYPW